MITLVRVLVLVPGVLFLVTGLRWLLAPATLAVCILMGLTTQRSIWYYPPIILLSLTAIGRTLAWLLHNAALATDLIVPEVVVALILFLASRYLPERS
jgi:hypothetical protein